MRGAIFCQICHCERSGGGQKYETASYIQYVNIWQCTNIQKLINCADTSVYRLCLAYVVSLHAAQLTTLQVLQYV